MRSPGWPARVEGWLVTRVPRVLRRAFRRVWWLPLDLWEGLGGRRSPLVPPRGRRDVGAGDFVAVGDELFGYLLEHCALTAESRVLDVGCGIGRMARPLTSFLGTGGGYLGFDVARPDTHWCQRHVSRRFPTFRFEHVDVLNREYNPRGRIRPGELVFPSADAAFDVVVATSLFTHLLEDAAGRYMTEIARVLRPGGRCLATFFLLNDEVRELVAQGRGSYRFAWRVGSALVDDAARPEAAVAYEEALLRSFCGGVGLVVHEPILGGAWCGRERFTSFQDLVVLERPDT